MCYVSIIQDGNEYSELNVKFSGCCNIMAKISKNLLVDFVLVKIGTKVYLDNQIFLYICRTKRQNMNSTISTWHHHWPLLYSGGDDAVGAVILKVV